MVETLMSVGIITALFGGAATLLKVIFGSNQARKEQYSHEETIIKLMQNSNDNSIKLLAAIENLNAEVKDLRSDLCGLSCRVDALEEEVKIKRKS